MAFGSVISDVASKVANGAIGSTIGDMSFNITTGAINQTLSTQLNNIEHFLIHGKHKDVRFYYDQKRGGNILSVATTSLINGAVSELSALAKNTFKDLLWGKDKPVKLGTDGWAFDRMEAIKAESEKEYGKFPVNTYKTPCDYIYATDHQGYRCRDALMLGIPLADNKRISFSQEYRNEDLIADFRSGAKRNLVYTNNYIPDCDHLVWFDTTAIVNVESSKNLVVTQVQGRDYSRKELVSNGDLNISVSGYITSLYPDVYPIKEVTKLREILKYKGIIEVNNLILDGWDVSKIIIKDFSFPQEEGSKSIQKYSFNAIAVQPSRASGVDDDVIKVITQPFDVEVEEKDKWADLIQKQIERLKMSAGDLVSVGLSQGSDWLNNAL